MAKSYRVFTGAPLSTASLARVPTSWQTLTSREVSPPLLPATLEQAGHRLSLIYKNVIFEGSQEQEDKSEEWESQEVIELSQNHSAEHSKRLENVSGDDSSRFQESYGTDPTGDETTMLSEGSSISRFPTFSFNPNTISSLSSITGAHKRGNFSTKVTFLLGVLDVDGPSYVTVKTGPHAGSEVGLLKLIVGDERGAVSKIISWRETAELWGGVEKDPALKRGDVVLFENVLISGSPRPEEGLREMDLKIQITASPNLKSRAEICYRTLPHSFEDRKLRPDLRLADSVPAVRKVGEVVMWMERMAGIGKV